MPITMEYLPAPEVLLKCMFVEARCRTGQHCFPAATFANYTIFGAAAKYNFHYNWHQGVSYTFPPPVLEGSSFRVTAALGGRCAGNSV